MRKEVKFISYLLAAVMFFAALPVYADNTSYGVSDNVREFVVALELMSNDEIDRGGYVTRAYAAKKVIDMTKSEYSSEAQGTLFIDVPKESTYAAEIELAAQNGFVFGVGGGLYDPDSSISDSDMASIMLRYAGYEKAGASSSARSKLLKGVNTADALSYSDLAIIIYNTLNLNVIDLDGFSGGAANYSVDNDKTILNSVFDVYEKDGKVKQNDLTGLFSDTDVHKGEILLETTDGDIVLKVGDTDIDKMIGRKVTVYYRDDTREDEQTVIGYSVSAQKNTIYEISIDDIDFSTVSANYFEYLSESGKMKKIKSDRRTAIIYNGLYYNGKFSMSDISGMEGTVTAIDNDSDNIMDVFVVEAYTCHVIKSVLLGEQHIVSTANSEISLDPEDYDSYELKNSDGSFGNIEDFEPYQVLSVAKSNSATKKAVKFIISGNIETGRATSIYTDDLGYRHIVIDSDDDYKAMADVTDSVEIGQSITLYISAFSHIAEISFSGTSSTPFGILVSYKYNRKSDAVEMELITTDNRHTEYSVTGSIRIDGVKARTPQEAFELLETAANDPEGLIDCGMYDGCEPYVQKGTLPVIYTLRENGELLSLDTPHYNAASESTESLRRSTRGHHYIKSNIVGNLFAVESSAPTLQITSNHINQGDGMLMIPVDYIKDNMYTNMTTFSKARSDQQYYCSYKIGTTGDYADFMVIYTPLSSIGDNYFLMVDKVAKAYDEVSGAEVIEISGIHNGTYKTYQASEAFMESYSDYELQKGDTIRISLDGNGKLAAIRFAADLDLQSTPEASLIDLYRVETERNVSDIRHTKRTYMLYGLVTKREGDIATVKISSSPVGAGHILKGSAALGGIDKASVLTSGNSELVIKIPSNVPLSIYDVKDDKVYSGSYDELYASDKFGTACSFVGLRFINAQLTSGFVYNYSTLSK